jgi:tetratricopeptide (TPR) repeat protein/CHAT domain-containing protein
MTGSLAAQVVLTPDKAVTGTCRADRPSVNAIVVPAGTAARVVVEQPSEDLRIVVESPHGSLRLIDQFDFSAEEFTILSSESGMYRVRIFPVKSTVRSTPFSIRVASVQTATNHDASRVHAEDLATESKSLARDRSQWNAALESIRQSAQAWSELGEENNVARTHLKAGDLYLSHSMAEDARTEYRLAKGICQKLGDFRCVGEAANNGGLASVSLSDVEDAQEEFTAAIDAWRRISMPRAEASTHLNLGLLLWTTSEFPAALGQDQLARQAFRHGRPISLARVLNNIGLVYVSMADYPPAVRYFREALESLNGQPDVDAVRARVHINLGRAYMLSGRTWLALHNQQAAVTEMRRLGDPGGLAEAINNRGQVELHRGETAAATSSLLEALALYRGVKSRRGIASALHYLGVSAARRNDVPQARDLLQQALRIRQEVLLLDEAAATSYELAMLEENAGNAAESFRRFEDAIEIVEKLRSRVLSEQLRGSYLSGKSEYYISYVSALLANLDDPDRDYRIQESFAVSERYEAKTLMDLLGEDRLSARSASTGDWRRLRAVRRQINALSNRIAASVQDSVPAGARQQTRMDQLLVEEAELDSTVRAQSAAYRQGVDPPIAGITQIQQFLAPGDVLVKYSLGATQSHLWMVFPDRVHTVDLPSSSTIKRQVRFYLQLWGNVRGRVADRSKQAAWKALSQGLVTSLGLTFDEPPKRLVVITDGDLGLLPFAALPLRSGGISGGPLGLTCQMVQAPSASVFRILEERRRAVAATPVAAAVFADPVFDSLDSRVKRPRGQAGTTQPAGVPLPRLAYSQMVADMAEAVLPPERRYIALGFDVNRNNLFGREIGRYGFLFLLTHALVSDDLPARASSLVLSMVDREGRPQDGLVSLPEVYDLKLASTTVLVLACRTARQTGPSSTLTLSSGFLVAGGAGVVASPLPVQAEPTSFLVSEFLRILAESPRTAPAEALLKARQSCAHGKWSDPAFWAPLILTGGLS